jgi:threonine aldolase
MLDNINIFWIGMRLCSKEKDMLSFENDYSEGAHSRILKRLVSTDMTQTTGYGEDPFCEEARLKIRQAIEMPEVDIYFTMGGTQTNQLVIDTMLQPYEGVIAAESGHVSVHEAGAIEFAGHKVLTVPPHNGGKVDPLEVKNLVTDFYLDGNHEHMVFPGMLYISQPTEYGALYSKRELEALHLICSRYHIPLYLDGARLAYALASPENDATLQDIARLTDVFYIGGTKCGALCGEALVFTKNNTPRHFIAQMKQHGALMAKGRLLGIQFAELFTDNLYLKLGRNGIDTAEMLKMVLHEKYSFYFESPTNQQFVIVENRKLEQLKKNVVYGYTQKYSDSHSVIRFCTSWATRPENIFKLGKLL